MMNQISNLQTLQCFLDTQGYPVGRLKHGLPGPPDVMLRALRHGVGKFIGLENSKGESGIIACRSPKLAKTRGEKWQRCPDERTMTYYNLLYVFALLQEQETQIFQ